MAPLKKKAVESLENLSSQAVLSSIVADLYLFHLLKQDLKDSYFLTSLRTQSREELIRSTSQRLQFLPGLLNDQVRDKLIKEFFSKPGQASKWPVRLDILKVLLNETVTTLDLGTVGIPQQGLSIIAKECPYLTSLHIILNEVYASNLSDPLDSFSTSYSKLNNEINEFSAGLRDDFGPIRKRRRLSKKKDSKSSQSASPSPSKPPLVSFQHLTEAFIFYGATNELLSSLGQNSPLLEKLHICKSASVTDLGVKNLCLKYPENHTRRSDCHLHELRVRSFHLNPCCSSLKEIDTVGTGVSHFGVAFLLKHLPHLRSLGDCNSISEALEVLVGRSSLIPKNCALLPSIKRHTTRYKLSRMKEVRITSNKFLLLSSLCPELRELTLGHTFRELDLAMTHCSFWQKNGLRSQMGQLRKLKQLSLMNVGSLSVRESIKAIGHQLTHLNIFCCTGLDLPTILGSCLNLTSLTLDVLYVSAPYEALEAVRPKALRKLETVKLRSFLPSSYIDLILSNSRKLSKIEMTNIGDIGDKKIEDLVNSGHFDSLIFLLVSKAPHLTTKAASALIHKCPKLSDLQDLGGWNITYDQYWKLQNEIEKENLDINVSYGETSRDTDSDASSVNSDYTADLFNAFRNVLPIVII